MLQCEWIGTAEDQQVKGWTHWRIDAAERIYPADRIDAAERIYSADTIDAVEKIDATEGQHGRED